MLCTDAALPMTLQTSLVLAAVAIFTTLAPEAQAAPKKAAANRADPLAATDSTPAGQLAPYIQHIEKLLALRRHPLWDQAPGKLAVLRQSFTARHGKAEEPEKATLAAAIATCDRLTAALDERKKTLADITASASVRSSDDLGERRKDSLVKDIRPGFGRGRAADVELKRERKEAGEARREAAERDEAMTARSEQRWTERSTVLRKQITDAYSRIPSA
jgi:hypothetical protein